MPVRGLEFRVQGSDASRSPGKYWDSECVVKSHQGFYRIILQTSLGKLHMNEVLPHL